MADEYPEVSPEEIKNLHQKISADAETGGYNLNPDDSFTMELIRGLAVNKKRYGYMACPCRLASGEKADDLDIICPCDYRDPDVSEFDACFCALYVSDAVVAGEKKVKPIPERRKAERPKRKASIAGVSIPVWRCSVCGYLAAREAPPEKCPICKVSKERFQLFIEAS